MAKQCVIEFTVFKAFTIMVDDYNNWLQQQPESMSFRTFAQGMGVEQTDRNKALFGFLFLQEERGIVDMWREDDLKGNNRVKNNNFLKIPYPGQTREQKNKWRREHL